MMEQWDTHDIGSENNFQPKKSLDHKGSGDHMYGREMNIPDEPEVKPHYQNLGGSYNLQESKPRQEFVSPLKPPLLLKKLDISKLEKKMSTHTCVLKAYDQFHNLNDESDSKTVSARGVKSPRIQAPHDFKLTIKTLLDNSTLLGKGVETIELVSGFIKSIENYTGFPYHDISMDLDKKKEIEKSAFNNKLFKEIEEIAKIRSEYEERMEQLK